MWSNLVNRLGEFPNAVLTTIDASGYPFSMRCTPQVDEARQVLLIGQLADQHFQAGPAELLYHYHNEQLWDLKALQILGRLEQVEQTWTFHPERFIPGNGFLGLFDQMRSIFKTSADAGRYLKKRGIPRPKIRWDEFTVLLAEAKKYWQRGA